MKLIKLSFLVQTLVLSFFTTMIYSRFINPAVRGASKIFNKDSISKIRISNNLLPLPCNNNKCLEQAAKLRFVTTGIKRGGSQVSNEVIPSKNGVKNNRAFVAVGTNMGDRYGNLMKGMAMLESTQQEQKIGLDQSNEVSQDDEPLIRIVSTSFLRETAPMYVTNQPNFLNGAIEIETRLSPHELLKRLKKIESDIGRDLNGLRNGPRPIDLDIIYYGVSTKQNNQSELVDCGGSIVESSDLIIPHPRIAEREFVLAPLCDLGSNVIHPVVKATSKEMLQSLEDSMDSIDEDISSSTATQIIPLPRGRQLNFNEILIMGILNVTPDSFSDGGNYNDSIDLAVEQALKMEADGASIIDIGGESTRPGAKEVEVEIELQRTIPVIKKIRQGE